MGRPALRLAAHLAPARPVRLDRLAEPARRPRHHRRRRCSPARSGDVHPAEWSARSIVGLLYLITFGSLLAFTGYAWLLQNAPISKVSTYAYVNPVVAIALGWLILNESITPLTLVGAGIIVASVALVIRSSRRKKT